MASNVYNHTSKLTHLATNTFHYTSLLESYTKSRSLTKIKQIHAHIITTGLLSLSSPSHSSILLSNLSSSYALCGHVPYARKLFDETPVRKLFLYNVIIRMYSQNGCPFDVLSVFDGMLASGRVIPDNFTYPFVIKACGDVALLENGVVVHGKAVAGGFGGNLFVMNSLLAMYMNCGEIEMAKRVFGVMRERDVVSWTSMIGGYLRNGCPNEALIVFDEMVKLGVEMERAVVVSVLAACREAGNLVFGRRVQGIIEVKGLGDDVSIMNALIDMFAKCGAMDEAERVFDRMKVKDVVTWTTMINGHILNGDAKKGLGLCSQMCSEGVMPNTVAVVMLLQACAALGALEQGKCLHSWAIRHSLSDSVIAETALIDMYCNCQHIVLGFNVYAQSSQKTVAVRNAMISGYTRGGLISEALSCFKQLLFEGVRPNVVTVSSILPAFGNSADVQQACNIHAYLIRSGFLLSNEVVTGLVDLYSKCGNLVSSHKIFDEVPEKCRNITLWSALIAGYGAHGQGAIAVSLIKNMVRSGVKPNDVTFTCVLDACSHAGLVDEGLELFKLMLTERTPSTYHYSCIIDLLGRSGRLQEASNLVQTMPFQSNHAIWSALLGACAAHENVALGEFAAKALIELEPDNAGNYVLLSNIYAAAERWDDVKRTRSMINNIRSGKAPGQSSVVG